MRAHEGLRQLRREAGYRNADHFAEDLGIPRSTWYAYETGRHRIPPDISDAVMALLAESFDDPVAITEFARLDR